MAAAPAVPPSIQGIRPKTKRVPSGDQPGLASLRSPGINRCGVPPSAETRKIFQGPAWLGPHEGNPLAVGGPHGFGSTHRRRRKLKSLRAVDLVAPQGGLGVGNVGDPPPIPREVQMFCRNPRKIGHKSPGPRFVPHLLTVTLYSHNVEPLP